MNGSWLFYRLFLGLLLGGVITWALYREPPEPSSAPAGKTRARYAPFFWYGLLPMYFLLLLILFPILLRQGNGNALLGTLFQVFLQLALYDGLMLLLLPLLRRFVRPQTCVFLWLLPNYLYLTQQSSLMQLPRPLVIIPVPGWAMPALCLIWLAGFVGVLGWKIISHLRFRRCILKDAQLVTEPTASRLWQDLRDWAGVSRKKYLLVISPHITSPLSIGLFASTIRVVLPDKAYTQDELALILRHELIHIGRQDNVAKFFLAFCSALCWFNPLAWAAMRQGAEELELSCDQEVMEWTGDAGREPYARLLLRTAGEQAGFTTCLSASASSLRYRLSHVLHPTFRGIRGGLAGLAFFFLILSSGWVTLAYGAGTGQELLFPAPSAEPYEVTDLYRFHDRSGYECQLTDQDGLLDYLENLELRAITGAYDYPSGGEELWLDIPGEGYVFHRLTIQDDMIHTHLINQPSFTQSYQVVGGVDWEYLDTLLVPQ